MIGAVRLAILIYTILVRLYPQTFRAVFEQEMRGVFEQALAEAAEQGQTTLIMVCLRELGGLPTILLHEHLGDLRKKKEKRMKVFYLFTLIILTIACWLSASFLWGALNPGWLIVLAIVAWLLVSAMAWAARKMSARVWVYAELLVLAGLFLPTSTLVEILPAHLSLPFETPMAITLLLILSIALVIVALLFYSGLNLHKEWQIVGMVEGEGLQAQRKHTSRATAVVFALSALLLAKTLYNLYWFTVWDTTYDPLGYLWLPIPILAVLFSSIVLTIILPGKLKLAGGLYLLLITALMIAVSTLAQRVDFRELTEERAKEINQTIEAYYAQEGRYPQDLRQLPPRYILSLPKPVIIYGQDWCYDGGDDYYRLGYVYREHWSDPDLHGRIYKTKGEAPDLPGICAEEIAALEKRYPFFLERR